jgi:hypothetical protein
MVQTIKTYAEIVEKSKSMSFKKFYAWVCNSLDTYLITDIADYEEDNDNLLGFAFEYNDVVFDVLCDFTNNGKPIIIAFWKRSNLDEDFCFSKHDIYEVKGYEIDWCDFFHGCYYALNNHSKEFENCSGIKKFIYLSTEAREKMNIYESKCDDLADYIIYDEIHEKVGYVIVIEDQE